MNRKDFFFEQIVTQGDLDGAFDYAEAADENHRVDTGLVGIMNGLGVTAQGTPNLTVNVATGTAYDQNGRRVLVGSNQVFDLSPFQPVGAGTSKIVSVCVRFNRALSDPRTDGNDVTVFFERAESFELFEVEGAEVVGVPIAPAKPADGLVLADILLEEGDVQVESADIDTTTVGRRDWAFEFDIGSLPVLQVGTLEEVVSDNRQILNDHITDLSAPHAASSITFDNTTPALPGAPADLQSAWNELMTGASGTVNFQGATSFASTVTFNGAVTSNASVTVEDQLSADRLEVDDALNSIEFTATGASLSTGTGSPEGVVTASTGSLFLRTDAANLDQAIYFKLSGAGNTGWSPIIGAS